MPSPLLAPAALRRVIDADIAFTRFNAVRSLDPADGALESRRLGDVTAFRDRSRADRYYNRMVGFGEAGLWHLDALIAFYEEVGRPSSVVLTPDRADTLVLSRLARAGFRLVETHAVFAARCAGGVPAPCIPADKPARSGLALRRAVPADLGDIVALWAQSSEAPAPPAVVDRRAADQFDPRFPIYVAELDGRVVAMASMFVSAGVAWLANAETRLAYRRRGCQLALLHHRLREAKRLGCDIAITDTEFGSVSHRNIERAGFRLAYLELSLERPVT